MKAAIFVVAVAAIMAGANADCVIKKNYGCFVDTITPRTLPNQVANANSYAECAANCNDAGYTGTAGSENGAECWCSNNDGPQGSSAPASDCNKPCADAPTKNCGGESRLSEFSFSCSGGQTFYSCSGSQCIEDPQGPWTTPDCDSACAPPPPPGPGPSPSPPPGPSPSPSPPPPPGPTPPGARFICTKNSQGGPSCKMSTGNKGHKSMDECNKHCPAKSSSSLTGGSVVLIIFFCAILIPYFVFGALFMKFKQGKSGKEVIPNVEFWTELPGLIKDGFAFTFGKITGKGAGYSKL